MDADASFLTPAEAAALLRCSTKTVRRMQWAGRLTAFRLGGRVRYRKADVLACVEEERPAVRKELSLPRGARQRWEEAVLEAHGLM